MIDWEQAYRSGRNREYWELDSPSPELVGYLAGLPAGTGASALDLGCGTGWDAVLLARAGYRAAGLDISAMAIDLARARGGVEGVGVDWWCGDVLSQPFPDASFDLLTDRGCFHHLDEGQRVRYANEVARVLKPGGRLLIRGCRVVRPPFVPILPDDVDRHFAPPRFRPANPMDCPLLTNAGVIPGALVEVTRGPASANEATP